MYSNGANQEWGSEHSIANGVVVINVPGNNVYGKDDYSLAVVYTYVNGYGEVKTTTSGFSNNQGGGQAGTEGTLTGPGSGGSEEPIVSPDGLFDESGNLISTWEELVADGIVTVDGSKLTGIDSLIEGYRLVVPGSIKTVVNWYYLGDNSKPVGYFGLEGLKVLEFNDGIENFNAGISGIPTSLEKIIFHSSMVKFDNGTYYDDGSMDKGQCFNNPTTIIIEYKGVVYDFRDFNSDAMVAFNSLPECTHWCNEDSSVINCGHENCIWNCGAVSFT